MKHILVLTALTGTVVASAAAPTGPLTWLLEPADPSAQALDKGVPVPNLEGNASYPLLRNDADTGTVAWSEDVIDAPWFYLPGRLLPEFGSRRSADIRSYGAGGLCLDTSAGLSLTTDFTIEFYYKIGPNCANNQRLLSAPRTDDGVGNGYGFCMQLNELNADAGTIKVKVRTDTQPHGSHDTGDGFNKSLNGSGGRQVTISEWHHAALVYTLKDGVAHLKYMSDGKDDLNHTIQGYLTHPIHFDGQTPILKFGDSIDVAIDLIRYTPRALTVSELIPNAYMKRADAPETPTLGWWRFETGTPGQSADDADFSSVSNASFWTKSTRNGTLQPSSSVLRRDNLTDVKGSRTAFARTQQSMSFAGTAARYIFAENPLVHATNMTFETFFKWEHDSPNYTALARLDRQDAVCVSPDGTETKASGLMLWCLQLTDSGTVRVRTDSVPVSGVKPASSGADKNYNHTFDGKILVRDGKWHHIAVTYDYTANVLSLYVDYEFEQSFTPPYKLPIEAATTLELGESGNRATGYCLDEARYSSVVLQSDRFLRGFSTDGLMLLFR